MKNLILMIAIKTKLVFLQEREDYCYISLCLY